MLARTALIALLCWMAAAPAIAKEYVAERFDSRIQVRTDGSLLVTETLVFRFESGTFRTVFRRIPSRATDGIEFVQASMDGRVLPQGDQPGAVEVRRRDGLRVDWHFTPVGPSTHTFELVYVARGVVRHESGQDLLEWRALPREHAYRIEQSAVVFDVPAPVAAAVRLETRRVDGDTSVVPGEGTVTVRASEIRRNGWIVARVPFMKGAILTEPPAWQQRQAVQRAKVPMWLTIAGGVLFVGFVMLAAMRRGYDAPPPMSSATWSSILPPDDLPPALAGALVSNGSVSQVHAMSALFGLAERGVVSIHETRQAFGQRGFEIHREDGRHGPLAPHETALVETIFRKPDRDGVVSLSKARSNLSFKFRSFKDALTGELRDAGLLDDGRRRHRVGYFIAGFIVLALAVASVLPAIIVEDRFGGWPLLISAAIAIVALASFLFGAAETPLSNEGLRRAEAWRGYQAHMKTPQEIEPRWGASESAEFRILPFVIALGLGSAWAKFMKKRHVKTPAWFAPMSDLDSGAAFATFIAYGGAHASTGHAGGGGGVAGGGSSGAA